MCAGAKVIELSTENNPAKALSGNEYSIVTFYNSNDKSVEFKEIFKQAEKIFTRDKKPNTPRVAFGQLNLDIYPELALAPFKPEDLPAQVVISGGHMGMIPFEF